MTSHPLRICFSLKKYVFFVISMRKRSKLFISTFITTRLETKNHYSHKKYSLKHNLRGNFTSPLYLAKLTRQFQEKGSEVLLLAGCSFSKYHSTCATCYTNCWKTVIRQWESTFSTCALPHSLLSKIY